MIQKENGLYQAACDHCGKIHYDRILRQQLFYNSQMATGSAIFEGWKEVDGNLYCPDCVEWDRETKSYKPKEKKR